MPSMTPNSVPRLGGWHLSLLVLVAVTLPACTARANEGHRPLNVVFVLVDDLGQRDLGCYGSTFHETPAIERLATKPRPLFWHYPHYGNQGGAPGAAIRDGDWKLIEWFDDGSEELFNLAADPSETQNLLKTEPERAAALRRRLHDWQQDVGTVMTTPNPAYDPDRPSGRK